MDRTIRTGVVLIGGLAVAAMAVVGLVVALDVPFWAGLILLAVLDAGLLAWAFVRLKR
ncbi:MAG: hypothetical protein O3B65_01910 [Chloroflexi bacterium]|nr:hypothetical protein [Chloroflexota bacterium]